MDPTSPFAGTDASSSATGIADLDRARPPQLTGPVGKPASRGLVMAIGVVLAALAALAWVDARNAQQLLRSDLEHRLAAEETALAAAKARDADQTGELREDQARLALLEARLVEAQTQQASLEALYRNLAPSRDEIALTEIEQLLLLASQQLALASNVPAALAALQLADGKLAYLDRPQLLPLRRALARDMDKLKAVPDVDVAGIALKLDQAQAMIATLPLARDERLPEPPAKAAPTADTPWLSFLRDVWTDMQSWVRIEVSDRPAAPLVAPAQQYFLRENLRLRLLSARIALLARDNASFKSDVVTANNWLKQYFDTRVKPVQALTATLTQLAATAMPAELPDVSASLSAVRTLKPVRERAPEKSAKPASAAPPAAP
jgi:uroporphyrin-III C-methyltransferase